MKKSNVIVMLVLAVVSVFLLWLWYYLSFDRIDGPLDLVLSIVWWVIIALAAVLVVRFEARRQERVRAVYVAPQGLFNSEAGLVAREGDAVAGIEGILEGLEYGFDKADLPEADQAAFTHIVRSAKFDAKDGDAEPDWEGEVVSVADGSVKEFKGRAELQAILAAA